MSVLRKHLTKSELAVQVLRERVRTRDLKPGEHIRVEDLTVELDMSPTPIREGLRLLQADGLVTYRPHRGYFVAMRSAEDVENVYRVRMAVEPLAVELAVPFLTTAHIEKLGELHGTLELALQSRQFRTFGITNASWHWLIYDAGTPQYLKDMIHRLWEMVSWRTMWVIPGWPEESVREHERVMDAIYANDAKLAAYRMGLHIERGGEVHLEGDDIAASRSDNG